MPPKRKLEAQETKPPAKETKPPAKARIDLYKTFYGGAFGAVANKRMSEKIDTRRYIAHAETFRNLEELGEESAEPHWIRKPRRLHGTLTYDPKLVLPPPPPIDFMLRPEERPVFHPPAERIIYRRRPKKGEEATEGDEEVEMKDEEVVVDLSDSESDSDA